MSKTELMSIGKILKKLRIINQATQFDIAKRAGITIWELNLIEIGLDLPKARVLNAYAEVTGCKYSLLSLLDDYHNKYFKVYLSKSDKCIAYLMTKLINITYAINRFLVRD